MGPSRVSSPQVDLTPLCLDKTPQGKKEHEMAEPEKGPHTKNGCPGAVQQTHVSHQNSRKKEEERRKKVENFCKQRGRSSAEATTELTVAPATRVVLFSNCDCELPIFPRRPCRQHAASMRRRGSRTYLTVLRGRVRVLLLLASDAPSKCCHVGTPELLLDGAWRRSTVQTVKNAFVGGEFVSPDHLLMSY